MNRRVDIFTMMALIVSGIGLGLMLSPTIINHWSKTLIVQEKAVKPLPQIVQSAQLAAKEQQEIFSLSAKLSEHNLNLVRGFDITDQSYLAFMKSLLEEPEVVDQLAAYGIFYRATKSFGLIDNTLSIDIHYSPREILEYVESH